MSGRRAGMEATTTQRLSSRIAQRPASTSVSGGEEVDDVSVGLLRKRILCEREDDYIHVGSGPGRFCARMRRQSRRPWTMVTLGGIMTISPDFSW